MHRILLLVFISVMPFTAISQDNVRVLGNWTNMASISAYIRTTDSIQFIDPDSAATRYLQALLMSQSINFDKGTLYCLKMLGEYYFNKHSYIRSLNFLHEALPYCASAAKEIKWIVPEVYMLLGINHQYLGHNDSALDYYSQAYYLLDSLEINRPRLSTLITSNLGSALAAARQYDLAERYFIQAISGLKETFGTNTFTKRDSVLLALNYVNYGSWHNNYKKDRDSAQYWWSRAIEIYRGLAMKDRLQRTYANIIPGLLADDMLQPDLRLAKSYLDSAIILDSVLAANDVQLQIGLSRLHYYQKRYASAIQYAFRALQLCEISGERERKLNIYTTLSRSYAFLNDQQQSQRYQYLLSKLADSLLNENINRSVSTLEIQYRINEKNKILAERQAALYQQRFWLAGSIGGGLVLGLMMLGLIRNGRHKRRLHREQLQNLQQKNTIEQFQLERETEERERKRIAQELHDGLGVLLSAAKINQTMLARVLPEAENAKPFSEGQLILNQMQQEVEWITNNLVPDYITENGLESALHTLAAKFNRPGVFDIHLESYGAVRELHPDRAFSLYRALEEILHNAVKHSGGNQLDLQLMYHPDQLHISLEDNGKGFDTQVTYAGMGMQNIRNRIIGMGGIFELSSIPGKGTSYILQVPY